MTSTRAWEEGAAPGHARIFSPRRAGISDGSVALSLSQMQLGRSCSSLHAIQIRGRDVY